MDKKRKLDLKELQTSGILLEVNRRFFHPLGLALALEFEERVILEDSLPVGLFIYDYRDDPEGLVFESLNSERDWTLYKQVEEEWNKKYDVRNDVFGWMVQPMGTNLCTYS